jgi:polar amino acid transport system permease protein
MTAVDKPKRDDSLTGRLKRVFRFENLFRAPWWFMVLLVLWFYVIYRIAISDEFTRIYEELSEGVALTLGIAFGAYFMALIIGLLVGLIRAYPPEPMTYKEFRKDFSESRGNIFRRIRRSVQPFTYTLLYNAVTFYVEIMRGIPPLVFLLIMGFVIVPEARNIINDGIIPQINTLFNLEIEELVWRGRAPATAIVGLGLIYGAFLSEVFRAGIQAVPKGQVEAAKSLGMNTYQTMRYIVVPQAVRNILPPLGNNFISMIKDTSLATVLGTSELTQLARKWSGSTFQYLETYLVLSLIYLTLTVSGSLLVQIMERRLQRHNRR